MTSCDNGVVYDLDSYTCGGSQNVVINSSTNNTSLNVTNVTAVTNSTSSNDSV